MRLFNHDINFKTCENYLAGTAYKSGEVFSDPDRFQQACLIALSLVRMYHFSTPEPLLPPLIQVLDMAQTNDFFAILKLPSYFLKRYTAEWIDAEHLKKQFENLSLDYHELLSANLDEFLEQMDEVNQSFSFASSFKDSLKKYIRSKNQEASNSIEWDNITIKLIWSPVATLANYSQMLADIKCIPVFLQEWDLIHLAKYANCIGSLPGFKWVPSQCLDEWVRRMMCTAFAFKFIEACRFLMRKNTTDDQRYAAKLQMIASLAEFVFNLAILKGVSSRYVAILMFIAKSTGLYQSYYPLKPYNTQLHDDF